MSERIWFCLFCLKQFSSFYLLFSFLSFLIEFGFHIFCLLLTLFLDYNIKIRYIRDLPEFQHLVSVLSLEFSDFFEELN